MTTPTFKERKFIQRFDYHTDLWLGAEKMIRVTQFGRLAEDGTPVWKRWISLYDQAVRFGLFRELTNPRNFECNAEGLAAALNAAAVVVGRRSVQNKLHRFIKHAEQRQRDYTAAIQPRV